MEIIVNAINFVISLVGMVVGFLVGILAYLGNEYHFMIPVLILITIPVGIYAFSMTFGERLTLYSKGENSWPVPIVKSMGAGMLSIGLIIKFLAVMVREVLYLAIFVVTLGLVDPGGYDD